jgi:curved DNA-binding protein CbpA
LGKQVHPDATGMDTNELMKKVNEAYEKLKKEGKE